MIITGGTARGRRIESPEGLEVRPTASKVRQALFNILGAQIKNARVLDVFAGSGLMGFEALSRGAQALTIIEENRKMVRAINASLKVLGFEAQVLAGDFREIVPRFPRECFDLIIGDPPYKSPFGAGLVRIVDKHKLLAEGGVLAIEHPKGYEFPTELEFIECSDCRHYGQTGISFFRRNEQNQAGKL